MQGLAMPNGFRRLRLRSRSRRTPTQTPRRPIHLRKKIGSFVKQAIRLLRFRDNSHRLISAQILQKLDNYSPKLKFIGDVSNTRTRKDSVAFGNSALLNSRNRLVFWVDGSAQGRYPHVAGAAVVYQQDSKWIRTGYHVPHMSSSALVPDSTGFNSTNAETFAIAKAIGVAITMIQQSGPWYHEVHIFSDALWVLNALKNTQSHAGARKDAQKDPYRMETIYRSMELSRMGFDLKLHWVKGHSDSVGNAIAHDAAVETTARRLATTQGYTQWVAKAFSATSKLDDLKVILPHEIVAAQVSQLTLWERILAILPKSIWKVVRSLMYRSQRSISVKKQAQNDIAYQALPEPSRLATHPFWHYKGNRKGEVPVEPRQLSNLSSRYSSKTK